jgi:NAD(P)H-dependent FMN reductase
MSAYKIGIVVSSSRPTRIGHKVAQWVSTLAPEDVAIDIIDLAEVDLPFLAEPELPATGNYTLPSTRSWSDQVRGFDALILTVPEYNAGYPAVLKNAIDSLHAEWNGLPIGVIGYGWGAAAGSVRQLGEVLDRVQAVSLPGPGLSFGQHLTPEGELLEAAPAQEVRGLYDQVLAAVREKVAA